MHEESTHHAEDAPVVEQPRPPAMPLGPSGKPGPEDLLMYRTLPATQGDIYRLSRLLWVFVLLTVVFLTPYFIGRIKYALVSADERAKYDAAKEHLVDFQLDQLSTAYRMLPDLVKPSVVSISTDGAAGAGQGSGVIVDKEGYIVTNYHVVEGVATAEIQLSNGEMGAASVVGTDPLIDIAVLKTELDNLIPAEWADDDSTKVGDLVWAIGSPFGLSNSITSGIISAKERRFIAGGGNPFMQEYLQTDAAVNPGNSGGPLVNILGKVVGINTAIIDKEFRGISFAIPADRVRDSYEQLRETGHVERGFLGVSLRSLTQVLADRLGIDEDAGILIWHVYSPTPASKAGLRPGDVVLSWNGEKYSDPGLLSQVIAATPVGDEATVKLTRRVKRDDAVKIIEKKLNLKVGAFPQLPGSAAR